MAMEKITFQVDRASKKLVGQAAKERSMSVSEFIRVACKEKMDAQSTILPIVEDMRSELSVRLAELERLVRTSQLRSESTQDKFNQSLTTDLRKGLVVELDQHLQFMNRHLVQNLSSKTQSNNAVKTKISEFDEKLEKFKQMQKNSYERLKGLDELMRAQVESKWWKRD